MIVKLHCVFNKANSLQWNIKRVCRYTNQLTIKGVVVEIIEEARRELKLNHQTLRPVNTKRPETPLDDNIRRLFRQNSVGDLRHRPDSVVRFVFHCLFLE